MVVLALEEMVEPSIGERRIVPPGIALVALTHDRVLGRACIAAVQRRRDHEVLLFRHGRRRGLPHVIEESEIRPDRDIVPAHEIEAWHVDHHVVPVQPTAVPRGVAGSPLNHAAAGDVRLGVGEDAGLAVDRFEHVLLWQVLERLRPVPARRLGAEVEVSGRDAQIVLRRAGREDRMHGILHIVREPVDEQHLHRAAAIPVALFGVRLDASDTGAKALWDDRRQPWRRGRGNPQLPLRSR